MANSKISALTAAGALAGDELVVLVQGGDNVKLTLALLKAYAGTTIEGLTFRGAYDNATAYATGDVVDSAGSSYIAIASTTGHTPPNATYWMVFASKGTTGDTGPKGDKGDTGDQGATGATGGVWYTGSGAPSDATGANGDWYLRSSNGDVYHKAAGTWGSVVMNLKGPQGDAGATGATGSTGATGATGAAGADGTLIGVVTYTADQIALLTDAGKKVRMNSSSGTTYTIPPNSDVAFAVGTTIYPFRKGTGSVTIAAGSGVTINFQSSKVKLNAQYSSCCLHKVATNEWDISGDMSV